MPGSRIAVATSLVVTGLAFDGVALASGVTLYEEDGKYAEVGGRIQVQYHYMDPDDGDSTDELFFRRLRLYLEGSLHPDWMGKFQWDMGGAEGDDEVDLKDAYFSYRGYSGLAITLGNKTFPFSREVITSSKKQQLVERTFVGDHNYGTPERQLGLHLDSTGEDPRFIWAAAVTSGALDPDTSRLDFDTVVNRGTDFVEGWLAGARVGFHPAGYVDFSQGDFDRDVRYAIEAAAFTWSNDDDVFNDETDVDTVNGYELAGAFRGLGFSVDAEYNLFDSETLGEITEGLYQNGETELTNWAIEGGYMIVPDKWELIAGYQAQDADNYADEWTRTSIGANYFFRKHDIKAQLTYRSGSNIDGVDNNDEDEIFLQAQYVL